MTKPRLIADSANTNSINGDRLINGSVPISKLESLPQPSNIPAQNVEYTSAEAGAIPRSVRDKFGDVISVMDFGAVGTGASDTNDAPAVKAAIEAALAGGRTVYFPPGVYRCLGGTSQTPTNWLQFSYQGVLNLVGNNATILNPGGLFPISVFNNNISFNAEIAAQVLLAADCEVGDYSIEVSDASNIEVGQVIYILAPNTEPLSSRPYKKSCTFLVARIRGNTVFLSEPLNFWFTVAEGTTITTYYPATLNIEGVSYEQEQAPLIASITNANPAVVTTATPHGFANGNQVAIGQALGMTEINGSGYIVANATATTFELQGINSTSFGTYAGEGVTIRGAFGAQGSFAARFSIGGMQFCTLINSTIKGRSPYDSDQISYGRCYGFYGKNLSLINGRYTFQPGGASRNFYFEDIYAKNCRHPIDGVTFAYGIYVKRLYGVNTQDSLQCHPCFENHFEDCTDFTENVTGGLSLRCFGGSLKRCKIHAVVPQAGGRQGPEDVKAEYASLANDYFMEYEDVEALQGTASTSFQKSFFVKRCKFKSISVDGTAQGITRLQEVYIDSLTETLNPIRTTRLKVFSPDGPSYIETPPETFASLDVTRDIIGITKANPAVVTTSSAHGFVSGDLVIIFGVNGMTEVNGQTFTVANPTSNSFQLQGLNSSSFGTYTSGGKVTQGRLAKTLDPRTVPGLGWFPKLQATLKIARSSSTISPNTSVTIPVKVIDSFSTGGNRSSIKLNLKADTNQGICSITYGATVFKVVTSGSSFSGPQPEFPTTGSLNASIQNFRHHYLSQINAEGGGESYYSFDVVLNLGTTSGIIRYAEVFVEEARF
jgi:hypothetical protein